MAGMYRRLCRHCGRLFRTQRNHVLVCSTACRNAWDAAHVPDANSRVAERKRERYKSPEIREKVLERNREYRAASKDRINAARAADRATNPEKYRKWDADKYMRRRARELRGSAAAGDGEAGADGLPSV